MVIQPYYGGETLDTMPYLPFASHLYDFTEFQDVALYLLAVVKWQFAVVISKIIAATTELDIIARVQLATRPSFATIATRDRVITSILASSTILFHTFVVILTLITAIINTIVVEASSIASTVDIADPGIKD